MALQKTIIRVQESSLRQKICAWNGFANTVNRQQLHFRTIRKEQFCSRIAHQTTRVSHVEICSTGFWVSHVEICSIGFYLRAKTRHSQETHSPSKNPRERATRLTSLIAMRRQSSEISTESALHLHGSNSHQRLQPNKNVAWTSYCPPPSISPRAQFSSPQTVLPTHSHPRIRNDRISEVSIVQLW